MNKCTALWGISTFASFALLNIINWLICSCDSRWNRPKAHLNPKTGHMLLILPRRVRIWRHEGCKATWFGLIQVVHRGRCIHAHDTRGVVLGHRGRRVDHWGARTARLDTQAHDITQLVTWFATVEVLHIVGVGDYVRSVAVWAEVETCGEGGTRVPSLTMMPQLVHCCILA